MAQCTEAFSRGWGHTIRLLFRPFRLLIWLKMALLALLVRGLSSFMDLTTRLGGNSESIFTDMESTYEAIQANLPYYVGIFVVALFLYLIFIFFNAVARFLFYDGVLNGMTYFFKSWSEHFSAIITYFLWNIVVSLILGGITVLFFAGIYFFIIMGFSDPQASVGVGMALGITLIFGLGLIFFILWAFYMVILDNLVVPQMLVKKRGIIKAWAEALGMVLENLFDFIGFILIRFVVHMFFTIMVMFLR